MDVVSAIFDRMDEWRHLPSYQLERRADIFLSVYLREVLQRKFALSIKDHIIPEFPVRNGTIDPNASKIKENKSKKIDYVLFTEDMTTALFVELKTEGLSRRAEQDEYLRAAQSVGMTALLEGVLEISRAPRMKHYARTKYCRLLELIAQIGLIQMPKEMASLASAQSHQGINRLLQGIRITCPVSDCRIVYVQPTGGGEGVIDFTEFSAVVREHDDPFSQRFAKSLGTWGRVQAGKAQ